MRPTHVVEIVTPKRVLLNGLWFGPKRASTAIVWIHGLTSSAFSKLDIVEKLVDEKTAVLTFSNRGHASVVRIGRARGKSMTGGGAYEKFEDCVDDIQGAINLARRNGAKKIFLAGHSTGCQKSIYWAYRKGRGVKGIILLAPMSDYAGAVKKYGLPKLRHMQMLAKAMLKGGKHDQFVSSKFWTDEPDTPRRFLSLYTADSVEQSIFSYFEPSRRTKILSRIRLPILSVLAEKDEYADRKAEEIVRWFETHTKAPLVSLVAKDADHGFKGKEASVSKAIKNWIRQVTKA